ncbi:MAG: dynamin family protein [Candidatus Competibacteraceae bacterium]|nr:MAG: dynamin family protein [Candidatus Competibacteraceae bacterium]
MTPQANPAHEPLGSFVDYKKVVLGLSSDLRQLQQFSERLELRDGARLIADVLDHLEKQTFTVAVVGEFKTGKSSFVNALLGVDALPTDILPTTATLNRVSFGLQPSVSVRFRDGREETIPFDDLKDYVTKLTPEAEALAQTIEEAVIYYPSPYCQNNVDVYDTPGLNDDEAMTRVTLSVLPETDAAILVISAQAPFSEYTRHFLENYLLASDLGRVIFVVTRLDQLNNPADAERILATIEQRIAKNVINRARDQYGEDSPEYEACVKKIGRPKVFGVSAYQAIQAKQGNDPTKLAASRFPQFEEQLEVFLTQQKGAVMLQVPVNRVIVAAGEILRTIQVREAALSLQNEEFDQALAAAQQEIETLRQRQGDELRQIDDAAEQARIIVLPMADRIADDLRTKALASIDAETIEPAELSKSEVLNKRLSDKVGRALRLAGEKQAQAIQQQIELGLTREIERLADFDAAVGALQDRINVHFGVVTADAERHGTGELVSAVVSVFTGFGGIWSGYRVAGTKGAMVGAAGSAGTAVAGGVVLGILSLPLSFPAILAIGIVSIFTGGWLAKTVFKGSRVEHFKEQLKKQVGDELDRQLKPAEIRRAVEDQVKTAFAALRAKVANEAGALLRDVQENLHIMQVRRQRQESMSEGEHRELLDIRSETEKILGGAQRLSQQLVKVLNI